MKRGFSANKEILQDNLQENSIISQRLICDTIHSTEQKLHILPSHLHYIEAGNLLIQIIKSH